MIEIFTDGASSGNPGPGGYGAILRKGAHYKELSEGFRKTTNNRMELLAVIKALEALKASGQEAVIYTDSKYVIDAVQKGWLYNWMKIQFKGKKNKDLWLRFYTVFQKHKVRFVWIKGHAGHPENERCDALAVAASKAKPKWQVDDVFEQETATLL